jgi:hypothetical protein
MNISQHFGKFPQLSTIIGAARNRRLQLAGVIALAFGVRAIFLLRGGSQWTMNDDSEYYLALARGLTHGCGFAPFYDHCGSPEVFRTPGYPVFLTIFRSHYRTVIFVQAMIGALACFFVADFTTRKHGMKAAVIAATFVAFDIPTVLLTKEVMSEALFQCLAPVAVFTALEGSGILSGAILGACIFIRPVGLFLMPIAVIAPLLRRRWKGSLAVFAVSTLVVVGWALRNERRVGMFTFTVEGVGNLYWYTAPAVFAGFDSARLKNVQESFERECDARFGSNDLLKNFWGPVTTPAGSRFMLSKSLAVILRHPIWTALITFRGFVALAFEPYILETGWQGFVSNQVIFRSIRLVSTTFQLGLLGLLYAGTFQSLRRHPGDSERWLLLSAAVVLLLAAAPFSGNLSVRFRSPAIPFLAVLAGAGWSPRPKS